MELVAEEYGCFVTEAMVDNDEDNDDKTPEVLPPLAKDLRMGELKNLTNPQNWYPLARSLAPRKIIVHVGPTNSGKTYNALQALTNAKSGAYLGPLRLLAWEIYDKLNSKGIPCNLVTGQELDYVEGAQHVSCTVEMIQTERRMEVAVIDEMQMIGDKNRGSAWTSAFLGVAADEVHVCGDATMVPMVEELSELCGDHVEIKWYSRKTSLSISPPVVKLKDLKKGDCLIAFSRKRILAYKQLIEEQTDLKACAVYGSLPPETRRAQAELFNSTSSNTDVIVASDAIGMGLNLNIGRVIFASVRKFDGKQDRYLLATEALQIGGRAGRFGTEFEHGYVTTIKKDELKELSRLWKQPLPTIHKAGLQPPLECLYEVLNARPDQNLADILHFFSTSSVLSQRFFLTGLDHLRTNAMAIQDIPLQISDRLTFVVCPARVKNPFVRTMYRKYAQGCVDNIAPVDITLPDYFQFPRTEPQLEKFETLHSVLDIYLWLANRIGQEVFVDFEYAKAKRVEVAELLADALTLLGTQDGASRRRNNSPSGGGRRRNKNVAHHHHQQHHHQTTEYHDKKAKKRNKPPPRKRPRR